MKSFCLTRGQLRKLEMEEYFDTFPPEFEIFIFPARSREGDLVQGSMMITSKSTEIDFQQWLEEFKKL